MGSALHLDGGEVLPLDDNTAQELYESLWTLAVGTRGAVTAAGKVLRARSVDACERLDPHESRAVLKALERVEATVRDSGP